MESSYFEYVHNLNGSSFENLKKKTREAIISYYRSNFNSHNDLQKAIIYESSLDVFGYISKHLDLVYNFRNIVFTTERNSYVDDVDFNEIKAIINFKNINSLRYINEHLKSVNTLLPEGGMYIGRVETYWERKLRIYGKFGRQIGRVLWLSDFVINRIIPKIKYINNIYFYFTKGLYHTLSRAEILGRLVYCGFSIVDYKVINQQLYFVAIKTGKPMDYQIPSFHPIIRLQRLGRNGKKIGVYKLRTMHPYSEYLQDYVIRLNGYNDKGKPADDFRSARWGRFFRRYWIDNIPHLINLIKGEMKLVGLRPLSKVRFNEFPEDLRKERIKYKPGCIAPYVALKMPDDKMNIEAERIYIKEYLSRPFLTDCRYLVKAIFNIFTHRITSS